MSTRKQTIKEFIQKTDFFNKLRAAIEVLEQSDCRVFEGLQSQGACDIAVLFDRDSVHLVVRNVQAGLHVLPNPEFLEPNENPMAFLEQKEPVVPEVPKRDLTVDEMNNIVKVTDEALEKADKKLNWKKRVAKK